jgi:hypothetical protein
MSDLDGVLADLPDVTRPSPSAPRKRRSRNIPADVARYVVICAICVAVWAASGMHGSFWPIWVIICLGAVTAMRWSRGIGR